MIIFENIKFKNFLSYGNQYSFIDFLKSKRTIILGKNGAGKSALIDAITYALYGKPFRKINKGSLINTINKKDLKVVLNFRIENTQYKIIRGMRPGIFEIYIDGVMVPQDASNRDYQKYLENDILCLNYRTFTQIVILGSSSYVPFMRMKSSAKREIIEDILNITMFSKMNEILKGKLKDTDLKLNFLEKDMELSKKQYKFLFEKSRQSSINKEGAIQSKNDQIQELEDQIAIIENEALALEMKKQPIDDINSIKKKYKQFNEFKIQITSKLKQVLKEVEFYNENSSCSQCKTVLTEEYREQRLELLNAKSSEYKKACEEIEKNIIKLKFNINEYKEINEYNQKIRRKEEKLKSEINTLKNQITYIRKDIEEINTSTNDIVQPSELEALRNTVKQLDCERQNFFKEIDIMKMGLMILKDNGAKTRIIKFYLPLINKTVNDFLECFDFNVLFTFDENFDESIKARNIDTFTYGNFSEGERMRIDLSLMFTWREIAKRKNSASTNLLFFDEILDSAMDAEGLEMFMNIIEEFDPETNLFVISHREGIDAGFDSVIQARKPKLFSEYNTENLNF